MVGIIGLLLAIVVLVVGAYKGLGALPLTLLAALVAIVANASGVGEIFATDYMWRSFSQHYMKGYTDAYTGFFLLFACSSLYAKLMNDSGSATAIGYKLIDAFGRKNVILVSILITSVLTYGGVSLFVVVYAVAPIMFLLFKEANLPRHLTMGCLIAGSATYTMTTLPGTPQLTNVVPTQFLGTTLIAAPVLSIVCTLVMFALIYGYMMWATRRARSRGEEWSYPEGIDLSKYEIRDRSVLPPPGKAFAPIIVLCLMIVIGSRMGYNATMLSVYAMLAAAIVTYLLNIPRFAGADWKAVLTEGLGGGISGIGGLAAVLAFGTVVRNTSSFTNIVDWVLGIDMHPYVRGIFSVSVFSGITGSSSGGLRITLDALSGNFMASGANMEILHRLMSIAAGGLDTLPHSPGLFLMMTVLGLDHKSAYRHIFVNSVLIPVIVVIGATVICIALGM